jgi:preprotein translocase subunit SecG
MFAFLLTLLILDALILSAVVLLQAGQGGGLASLGGATTDTVLGGRQAVTILTKLSWWCGGIFLALALILSFVPRGGSGSALQERLRATTPAAPAPSAPLPLGTPSPPPAQGQNQPGAGSGTTPSGAKPGAPAPAPSGGAPAPQQQPGK